MTTVADDGQLVGDADRYHFVPGTRGPHVVGGDGVWLKTADGRRILDAAGGAIVANIGHGRREVADAVRDALDGGATSYRSGRPRTVSRCTIGSSSAGCPPA